MSDRHPLRLPLLSLLLALALGLSACTSEKDRLEAIAKSATSRSATAIALRTAFYTHDITANGAIDLAYARVDRSSPNAAPGAPSASDIAFAGAVLDFLDQAEPDIDKKVINDFFWIRVGTLAGNAAAAARKSGDLPTARALVLAGPKHWQTDNYWRQCPAHDALASMLLFESGEGPEALNRLRDRPELPEEVQTVKDTIEKEMKKRPRK
jgi:hypothetical protein